MDTLELIHAKIHGLRMIPKYKPSQFEQDVSFLITTEFEKQCRECQLKLKQDELRRELPQAPKQGLFQGLFG